MCYHAEFGRSALKDVGVKVQENPKYWIALEIRSVGMGGVADPKIHVPPRHVTPSNLVVLRQWCTHK